MEEDIALLPWKYHLPARESNEIRFIPGPEWNWLNTKTQTAFLNSTFTISPAADRMGCRLQGTALEQEKKEQLISSAVRFGTVQLLPSGQAIVLMADHQTTGGYPRIANVISAHLPRLAQMNTGEELKFVMTAIEEAEEKHMTQQNSLRQLQNTCKLKIQTWLRQHT
jgi:antagonist of KipI